MAIIMHTEHAVEHAPRDREIVTVLVKPTRTATLENIYQAHNAYFLRRLIIVYI